MERLTRPEVMVYQTAARFMGGEVKIQDIGDKLLHLILNGPTINSVNKDALRHLVRQLYEALQRYEDLEMTPEDIEHQLTNFSSFLMEMTGGRMSKTNYTVQAMVSEANDHFESVCDECFDRQELAKIEAAKHPIKPGDTVYWILYDDELYVSSGDKILEVGTMGFFVGDYSFDGKHEADGLTFFPFDVLGKQCFLSQEEAEEAIAKMKEG